MEGNDNGSRNFNGKTKKHLQFGMLVIFKHSWNTVENNAE